MFGSEVLEVAIGVIFVFLLVSVLCSAIREGLEGWLKTRAAYLEHGIRELLHDTQGQGLANALYSHPLIYSLYSGEYPGALTGKRAGVLARGAQLPSYIPTRSFAIALLDIEARGPDADAAAPERVRGQPTAASLRAAVRKLNNPPVERVLLSAIDTSAGNLEQMRESLEAWYDSGMDRVSGMYRRATQWILLLLGLILAVGLNINAITIADHLYRNDELRAALVARAEAFADDTAAAAGGRAEYRSAIQELDSLGLPIGWAHGWGAPHPAARQAGFQPWNDAAAPILGWLITALAAMAGAPFWFDVLNKVMVIRSTVKPHEKSPEEGSEDRQPRPRRRAPAQRSADRDRARGRRRAVDADDTDPVPLQALARAGGGSSAVALEEDEEADGCGEDFGGAPTGDEELPGARGGVG